MAGLLAACSPVGVLNGLAPRAGVSRTLDVAYAAGQRHSLDIYAPEGAERAPVIVFFYGGSWQDGDKATYRFLGAALARRGFVAVIPDYRVYPAVRFPGYLLDAARAVAWTRAHIAAWGGDPGRLVLMGHSAGAQIATLLTLDPEWLGSVGLDPDRVLAACIGLAGPYDFLPLHDPVLEAIFAPAGDLRRTQPIHYARGDAPPLFLAAGTADTTVLPRNARRLAEAVRADGGVVEERLYPGIGHATLIGAFAGPLRWLAPVLSDVTGFLRAHGVAPNSAAPAPGRAMAGVG
jgi:acetyl esterase/lipase